MNFIRTIMGDISVEKMGFTLPHEHLMTNPPENIINKDPDLLVNDETKPVQELKLFKLAGGKSFVEMSPSHYGRNLSVMIEASQDSEINVIATTGYLKGAYFPKEVEEKSINELADYMITEVVQGMDGTNAKAGVIKAGTSYNRVTELEIKVFKAAVIAAKETGAPISTHTEYGTMGPEQVEIVINEGLDPSRLIVGHMGNNPDYYLHRKVLTMGAYLINDAPSKVKYATDQIQVDLIRKLVADGFEDRIMLSCDMGRRKYWKSYGGGPGFEYIPRKFIPRLIDEGIPEDIVYKFNINNPAKAFVFSN